ncbi:hypothetical protein ABTF77_20685, partial [Acinetobacter baumannii]
AVHRHPAERADAIDIGRTRQPVAGGVRAFAQVRQGQALAGVLGIGPAHDNGLVIAAVVAARPFKRMEQATGDF